MDVAPLIAQQGHALRPAHRASRTQLGGTLRPGRFMTPNAPAGIRFEQGALLRTSVAPAQPVRRACPLGTEEEKRMAHPNEELVRQGYKAFGEGDMDTLRSLFAPDAVHSATGNSPLVGRLQGRRRHPWLLRQAVRAQRRHVRRGAQEHEGRGRRHGRRDPPQQRPSGAARRSTRTRRSRSRSQAGSSRSSWRTTRTRRPTTPSGRRRSGPLQIPATTSAIVSRSAGVWGGGR